jgi:uncharacterized protein (DUF362 family)
VFCFYRLLPCKNYNTGTPSDKMECVRRDARSSNPKCSRYLSGWVILCLLAALNPLWAQLPPVQKSYIFYAMDNSSVGPSRTVNPRIVQRMVDSLICAVALRPNVADAWRVFVTPKDIVGIKVAAGGRGVSGTNPEVVDAIAKGLISAGVPPKNIIVWDRNLDDLLAAGYRQNGELYQLQWIDPRNGYDSEAQVSAPVLGKLIWGDSQFGKKDGARFVDLLSGGDQLSSRSFYAKVLSQTVTKVINVPSLCDSFMTGINGGIVNMTISNLDNWRRFAKASEDGDSYLSEVYADPMVKDKVVLTILDGLILQYAGGPFPNPNFTTEYYSIFASRDVVAIDATAIRLIDELRLANKLPSVKPQSAWLQSAAELSLGQFSESRIQTVRVGLDGVR